MKSISSTACISIALIVSIAGTDVKWGPVQIYNLIDGSPSYQPYRMEPATGTKALYDYLIEHDYDIMAAVDVVGDKMSPVGDDPNGSCVRQTRAYAPYTDSGIDTTLMAKPIFSDTPNGNDMLELLAHTVGTGFPPPIPHSGKTPYKAVLLSTSSKPRYNKDDMATPNPDLASHFNCALDYPGLEQVGKILRDSGVYIHAGVTDEVYEEWEDLFYNKLKLEKETTSVGEFVHTRPPLLPKSHVIVRRQDSK